MPADRNRPKPNQLRAIRKERGLTLKQLAEKCGLFFTQIAKMETGERPGKDFEYRRIGKALNIPATDLFHTEDGALSREERLLVERFRSSPQSHRRAIAAILSSTETDDDAIPSGTKNE